MSEDQELLRYFATASAVQHETLVLEAQNVLMQLNLLLMSDFCDGYDEAVDLLADAWDVPGDVYADRIESVIMFSLNNAEDICVSGKMVMGYQFVIGSFWDSFGHDAEDDEYED